VFTDRACRVVQDPKRTIFKGKGFALGKDAEAESEFSLGLKPRPKSGKGFARCKDAGMKESSV